MQWYKYFFPGLRWPDATDTVNIPTCEVICFPLFKLFWRPYNTEEKNRGGVVPNVCIYASTSPGLTESANANQPVMVEPQTPGGGSQEGSQSVGVSPLPGWWSRVLMVWHNSFLIFPITRVLSPIE